MAALGLLIGCGTGSPPSAPVPSASPASPESDRACSPAASLDGFSDALDGTTFGGTYVGNLSALAADGDGDGHIEALSDRSALFTLDRATLRPTGVVALRDEQGGQLDSEALVLDRDGTLLVSSETEPSIRRYRRDGTLLGRLPVPPALLVAPAGRAATNRTFEGLALQPDGRTLIASMEGALDDDQSNLVRFQTWTRDAPSAEFRAGVQYGYPIDPGSGVSEITDTGDGRLLVLERGFIPEVGNSVRVYLTDPSKGADISGVDQLAARPDLLTKTPLVDLFDCPPLGATAQEPQPNPLLDNVEGMTILGRDPDGALQLLLVSDDNQRPTQTTRLYRLTLRLPR
jgi:hypothetical protein